MSGYPQPQPGYGYGPPPPAQPYGSAPPQPYGSVPPNPYGSAQPYGAPQPYGSAPAQPYGSSQPYEHGKPPKENKPYDPTKPPKENKPMAGAGGYQMAPGPGMGYGSPFASLMPSVFPPGTDPTVVAGFQAADQDGSGFIDDKELQRALSGYNQSFSIRTVHLLMFLFTNTNTRKIGPQEFTSVFYSLQNWRGIFERFDRDRSGKIDARELNEALQSLGYSVSPVVLELLVSKYDKKGGMNKAIEYDNFIECCLTVKGLTEKFKEKDTMYSGSATFTYEVFMLTVLPFLIA